MPVLRRALLAAVAVLLALGAAPAAARSRVTLTGTYTRLAKDVGQGHLTHVYEDVLRVGERHYRLHLPAHAHPVPGSRVRVHADSAGGTLDVTSVETLAEPRETQSATPTSVLVILAYWTAPDSVTTTRARDQLFTSDNAWFKEVSYGAVSLTGTVTPWLRIPAPVSGLCYTYADKLLSDARAKARTLGATYDWTAFDRTVVYFPRCSGSDTTNVAGWAYEPGDSVWLNGYMDRRTSVHELGHSYGMAHADGYTCTSGGVRVTMGGTCKVTTYGDPYDAMGQSNYVAHFDAVNKDLAGWLGSRKRVLTTSTTTLTLAPFEKPSTLPLVAVADSPTSTSRSYWIEYRQPVGSDAKLPAGATGGVLVHLRDSAVGSHGYLLDPTPGDASFSTAVVRTGTSWQAPDGVRIAVTSAGTSGATVTVSGARATPTAPSVPRSFTAKAADRSVLLHWAAPSSTGGEPLTGYGIEVTSDWGDAYSLYAGPGEVSATASWLEPGRLYRFAVRATNKIDTGPAATASATPVDLPPTIRITSPASGATVQGALPVTVAAAADPGSNAELTGVVYELDGAANAWASSAPWSTTLSTAGVPNGPHTLRATVYDQLGRTVTATLPVTVANMLPDVAITSPATGTTTDAETLVLEAAASMPAPSTASVFAVSFYETSYGYDRYLGGASAAPWRAEWNVSQTSGAQRIVAVAYATNGTQRRSAPVDVTVTHPPPTIALTAPTGGTARGASVALAADAQVSAPGGAVASVVFFVDGWEVGRDGTAPYTATWDTGAVNGTHSIRARVWETSGRWADSATASIRVDNVFPVVTTTAPSDVAQGVVTLTGTARPGSASAPAVDHVDVAAGDVPLGRAALAADGTWRIDWDARTRAGTYYVRAVAYGTDGVRGESSTYVYVVPPVPDVTWVTPSDTVLVIGAANDVALRVAPAAGDGTTVARVCFGVDGYYWEVACASAGADGAYHAEWWPYEGNRGIHLLHPIVRMSNGWTHRLTSVTVAVAVAAPPRAPLVGVMPNEDNSITVSWSPASYYEPIPLRHWVVTLSPGGAERTVDTPEEVTFTGLRNGTRYVATVVGVNDAGTGPAGTGSAVAGVATILTGAVGDTSVTNGTRVYVSSFLSEDVSAAPLAGAPVDLVACLASGTRTCSVVGHGTTSSTGRVTTSFVATERVTVQARYAGDDPLLASVSPWTRVSVRARVTSALSSSSVAAGRTVHLTGRVYPALAGGRVYLQRYYSGAWHTGTSALQTSTGYVSLAITKPLGTYVYRLLASSTARATGAASPSRTLTVT
jgi:hypothetical protein